jgi:ubiquinone/menaquinone biosynthesis C-methylase UbiE
MLQLAGGLHCESCHRDYPIVLGIPDLRVYPDPYIGATHDYRKGELLQARAESLDFAGLVRFYWEITPETPPDLKERFIRHVLTDEQRASEWLPQMPQPLFRSAPRGVEIGCGTGALLQAMRPRFAFLVGCDIAFRWLVVARKRLEPAGVAAPLVCCCADYLPFPDGSFDCAAAISLLEHLPNAQQAAVRECARVLRKEGSLWVVSANRYSLAPEPHVRVWGVGFLPRRWMPAYVRWRRGLSYDKFRLLSCSELRRMIQSAGFEQVSLSLPSITRSEVEHLGEFARIAARLLGFLSRISLLRWWLLLVAPLLQVVGWKRSD